jgi:hypothetical protein
LQMRHARAVQKYGIWPEKEVNFSLKHLSVPSPHS